jgi:hypothetical protein
MKITQLGVLPAMLFLQLIMSSSVWATTSTINTSRSNIKNNMTIPVVGPSGAGPTAGSSGALTNAGTDTTTISNSPNNVNASLTSNDTTTTNRAVTTKGVNGALTTHDGNLTATSTDASTTSNSPMVKNGIVGDGVNVLSNTRLSAAISGNAVGTDLLGMSGTLAAGAGNAISGSAFAGANGISMVNMSSGHNSSVQSTVTVTPTTATPR